ncbi:cobalamin B12-binding domain-containing protein [Methyloversatilis discipulorum]|uniref:cobalamin B12-binding domain-containing protein n=1 Tax=Methyloversatilis discipulorum TaxID=1119528 RepID=UPI0004B86A3A|nr:cobalamin B12-binding domain-containing protein [Methyloversatilis discipulorum]
MSHFGGPPIGPPVFAAPDWLGDLAQTIEAEIIPRLMLAHGDLVDLPPAGAGATTISARETHEFANLVLAQDAGVVRSCVQAIRARGVEPRVICLDLLAPAARRLGELWEADLCDFTQVTLGLWRIQQVLHDVSPSFRSDLHSGETGRRVLLATLPGEQHTFGMSMVADFFRQRRWDVRLDTPGPRGEALRLLRAERFDLVGVSLGSETRFDELAEWITAARRVSLQRDIVVMVGGPIFASRPEWVPLVGADATARDASAAVDVAEALLPVRFAHG